MLLPLLLDPLAELVPREVEDPDRRRIGGADVRDEVEVGGGVLREGLDLVGLQPQVVATAGAAEGLDLDQALLLRDLVEGLDVDQRALGIAGVRSLTTGGALGGDHGLDGPGLDLVVGQLQQVHLAHGVIMAEGADDGDQLRLTSAQSTSDLE